MFALGFRGVQLALAPLGAVHLKLRRHQAKGVGGLFVTIAQHVDAPQRLIEGGGDRVRCAEREFTAQISDEPGGAARLLHIVLGLDQKGVVGRGRPLLCETFPPHGQLGEARRQLLLGNAGPRRLLSQPFRRSLCDLAVCLGFRDGLLLFGGRVGEFGTGTCRVGQTRRVNVRGSDLAKFGEPGTQHVDVIVSDQPVDRRRRPVAVSDELPAPLIEDARGGDVVDLGGRQCPRENLLCGFEFRLRIGSWHTRHHPRGQHPRYLDVGGHGGIRRPCTACCQRD